MQTIWQDLRYSLRRLANRPSFALLAVLNLALGIGAATTIFSVIQNVLLDPFPYTDARRVATIQVHDTSSSRPGGRSFFDVPEFLEYQSQNHVFDDVIGGTNEDVLLTTTEGTEQFTGGPTTPNTFQFLGVPAAVGRTLIPADGEPGAAPVFVMAHKMWVAKYNRDPGIVGRTFVLNGVPTTLVGIMPQRFTKLGADLWRPIVLNRADPALNGRYFMFQGKLKPGVTLQQAAADFDVIAHRLAKTYPKNYPQQFTILAVSWVDNIVGPFRATLYTLAAAVGLLLLIACSNVANMLLAKAAAREKEMAIRASMGASRARLVRQLLVESLILAAGGMLLGCLFSYVGIQGLVRLIPDGLIPREAVIRLNVPVLIFSLAVAGLTALLFGLLPALQTARRDIAEPLKNSGKGVSGGFRGGKLRSTLVVVEVALSLMLLAGAGLLMRSFVALQTVDLGMNPDNVLVARLPLPRGQYTTATQKQQFFRELLRRLQAVPGIKVATVMSSLPPYGGIGSDIEIPGKTPGERWNAIFQLVSEGYFQTLGLKLLQGRPLAEPDVNGARRFAVVNQTLVNRYFGKENPLGQQIRFKLLETLPQGGAVENPVFEIIGVVSDAKNQGIQDPPTPEAFIPYTVTGAFERGIMARTEGDPAALVERVRREVWAVDRGVAITMTGTLTGYLTQFSYATPRFSVLLLGVFATVGLVLVAIGVYSVIAYTVSQQTHEIGIRMALGAAPVHVLRMVGLMGLRLVTVGAVIGLVATFGTTRLIATQLFGTSEHDPLTLSLVVSVIALVGLVACYVPARRATKVDPLVALRG
jgi:putative ABC transport system permease protein